MGWMTTLRTVRGLCDWLNYLSWRENAAPFFNIQACLNVTNACQNAGDSTWIHLSSWPKCFSSVSHDYQQMVVCVPNESPLTGKFKPQESRQSSESPKEAENTNGSQPKAVLKLGIGNIFNTNKGVTTPREESAWRRQETHSRVWVWGNKGPEVQVNSSEPSLQLLPLNPHIKFFQDSRMISSGCAKQGFQPSLFLNLPSYPCLSTWCSSANYVHMAHNPFPRTPFSPSLFNQRSLGLWLSPSPAPALLACAHMCACLYTQTQTCTPVRNKSPCLGQQHVPLEETAVSPMYRLKTQCMLA